MPVQAHLLVAALACALVACDDKNDGAKADAGAGKDPKAAQAGLAKLNARCEQLGKACGEQDKHKAKITEECKEAAKTHVDKGCTDKAIAVYDCYEKEVCVEGNKIWAMDDFRVLTTRHKKCLDQRKAGNECVGETD